jgi:hypothetical protein
MGSFYYSAKAFDLLERHDPDPEYWEGKRGACVAVFQMTVAGKESKENLQEVMQMLRSTSNPQVEYIMQTMTKWCQENATVSSENAAVSAVMRELFQYIQRYKPQDVELEAQLKCFIPDYIPSIGQPDAFLKVPRPDGVVTQGLGLEVLDGSSVDGGRYAGKAAAAASNAKAAKAKAVKEAEASKAKAVKEAEASKAKVVEQDDSSSGEYESSDEEGS